MANTIKTVMTYPLNGSTVDFNIPFEYLARKFVTITLIGTDRKVLTLNQDYRFSTKITITLTKAWGPADGYDTIEVRRYTSATDRLVDFADGSILRAYDLNIAQVQTLHVAEEARDLTADTIGVNNDGDLDARGRRIVNVADPVDDFDALNLGTVKEWNNGAYQSYLKAQQEATRSTQQADRSTIEADRAKREADRAATSQAASASSESNAERSANNAKNSENAAAGSASVARTSENNAKNYETDSKSHADRSNTEANRSKAEADRAKTEADKLGNMNSLGGALDKVEGFDVFWKGKHAVTEIRSNTQYLSDPSNTFAFSWSLDGGTAKYNRKGFSNIDWGRAQHYNVDMRSDVTIRDGQFSVERANTGASFVLPPSDPPEGSWVARTVYKWYDSSGALGIVRGGSTDVDRIQMTIDNPGGQGNPSWYFRANGWFNSPGPLQVDGGGSLHGDGNIYGSLWGGYFRDWINNELGNRTAEINHRIHELRRGGVQEHNSNGATDWEAPWGYFTGYRNYTGDGNIKFTTW